MRQGPGPRARPPGPLRPRVQPRRPAPTRAAASTAPRRPRRPRPQAPRPRAAPAGAPPRAAPSRTRRARSRGGGWWPRPQTAPGPRAPPGRLRGGGVRWECRCRRKAGRQPVALPCRGLLSFTPLPPPPQSFHSLLLLPAACSPLPTPTPQALTHDAPGVARRVVGVRATREGVGCPARDDGLLGGRHQRAAAHFAHNLGRRWGRGGLETGAGPGCWSRPEGSLRSPRPPAGLPLGQPAPPPHATPTPAHPHDVRHDGVVAGGLDAARRVGGVERHQDGLFEQGMVV
jgi:hypothetical protein